MLGALINGVFLLALCLSIFLEAIQRFFEPQSISQPMLILVVGSAGLASNILGLFLFSDHGHSHGHGHSHAHDEEGHSHAHVHASGDEHLCDENGDIGSILPDTVVKQVATPHRSIDHGRAQFASPETHIHVHPAMNRQEILSYTEENAISDTEDSASVLSSPSSETTALLGESNGKGQQSYDGAGLSNIKPHSHHHRGDSRSWHTRHHHARRSKASSGAKKHSQSLNMRGVFIHVLGDALGNVGVIATALFIRFAGDSPIAPYADPAISLVITCIICYSALPLVKSASKILLQAVPGDISLNEIKEDIASIPGVESVHELHIWQLSDVKMIASLHIQIAFDPEEGGGGRYMRLAKAIRTCLHSVGVHSSTIQPEYTRTDGTVVGTGGPDSTRIGEEVQEGACLLECGDECGGGKCCAPVDENAVGNMAHGHAH